MTFLSLLAALKSGELTLIQMPHGSIRGHVSAIEREDGSGHCWNVTLRAQSGKYLKVFCRTIDYSFPLQIFNHEPNGAQAMNDRTKETASNILVALALVATMTAGFIGGQKHCDDEERSVDSRSFSADGQVALQLGKKTYWFAPNVARAVGQDLVTSATEIETALRIAPAFY